MSRKERQARAQERIREFMTILKTSSSTLEVSAKRLKHQYPQEASLVRSAICQYCREGLMTEEQIRHLFDRLEPVVSNSPAPPQTPVLVDSTMGLYQAGGDDGKGRGPRRSRRPE